MASILDTIKTYLSPELLSEAANIYGENEAGISKAVSSLAPAILAGVLEKSGDSHAIDNVFKALRNFDPAILGNLGSLLGGGNLAHNDPKDASGQLLSTIFGAKVPAIVNATASFSGVKQSTASSLLGLAGPMVMGILSQKINTEGLNASGMVSYLLSQKSNFMSVLPSGISAMLGMTNSGNGAKNEQSTGGMGWFWPLLLLLGLGAAIAFYLKNCKAEPVVAALPKIEVVAPAPAPAPPVIEKFTLKLSTGYEVIGSLNGIEAQLLKFIQDPQTKAGKDNWFDFDHLLFETASDQLNMEKSRVQLYNVYEILKAYPAVSIKIGGYTDNVGDAAKNKDLSARRAKTVQAELVKMGIVVKRLEAEGYGQEHPVEDNTTEEGRTKNRRVSVSVRSK